MNEKLRYLRNRRKLWTTNFLPLSVISDVIGNRTHILINKLPVTT
jgi:hypothetical protein